MITRLLTIRALVDSLLNELEPVTPNEAFAELLSEQPEEFQSRPFYNKLKKKTQITQTEIRNLLKRAGYKQVKREKGLFWTKS